MASNDGGRRRKKSESPSEEGYNDGPVYKEKTDGISKDAVKLLCSDEIYNVKYEDFKVIVKYLADNSQYDSLSTIIDFLKHKMGDGKPISVSVYKDNNYSRIKSFLGTATNALYEHLLELIPDEKRHGEIASLFEHETLSNIIREENGSALEKTIGSYIEEGGNNRSKIDEKLVFMERIFPKDYADVICKVSVPPITIAIKRELSTVKNAEKLKNILDDCDLNTFSKTLGPGGPNHHILKDQIWEKAKRMMTSVINEANNLWDLNKIAEEYKFFEYSDLKNKYVKWTNDKCLRKSIDLAMTEIEKVDDYAMMMDLYEDYEVLGFGAIWDDTFASAFVERTCAIVNDINSISELDGLEIPSNDNVSLKIEQCINIRKTRLAADS